MTESLAKEVCEALDPTIHEWDYVNDHNFDRNMWLTTCGLWTPQQEVVWLSSRKINCQECLRNR